MKLIQPSKILVFALPAIGDVLYCTPLLRGLRRQFPDATIDVLVHDGTTGILEGNPHLDNIIVLPHRSGPAQILRLVRGRFRSYDVVLSNSASDRAVLLGVLLGRSRVFRLRAHTEKWKRRFCDEWLPVNREKFHAQVQNSDLGRAVGAEVESKVVLPSSATSAESLAALLGDEWAERRFAVIHPKSSLDYKHWTAEGWQAVVDKLTARGMTVYVSGGPGDLAYIVEDLGLDAAPAQIIAGKASLADMAHLLTRAPLFIGVDTCVTHMASAAGIPVVALCQASMPLTWGPWPAGVESATSPWQANGSQRNGNVKLLQGIDGEALSIQQVDEAINEMLE